MKKMNLKQRRINQARGVLKAFGFVMLMAVAGGAHAAAPKKSDPAKAIHGIWKLKSYIVEVKATGEKFPPMGENPTGYTIFTPQGRTWFLLTGQDRKAGTTEAEKAKLLETVIAYTGKYRIEGDNWITSIDVAWNPAWVGTDQSRQFKLDGKVLQVMTPWRVMPNWADKGETRSIIQFEKDEAKK